MEEPDTLKGGHRTKAQFGVHPLGCPRLRHCKPSVITTAAAIQPNSGREGLSPASEAYSSSKPNMPAPSVWLKPNTSTNPRRTPLDASDKVANPSAKISS